MIEVDKIKDLMLRATIKENVVNRSISEEDYIKNAINTAILTSKNFHDVSQKLIDYGISVEQYESKVKDKFGNVKDTIYKLSFKTDRIKYGISEDKLGGGYSLNAILNKINRKIEKEMGL